LVGAAGFELATLCSQSRCATRLRYAPTARILTRQFPVFWFDACFFHFFEKRQAPTTNRKSTASGKAMRGRENNKKRISPSG
jgi:hypothetical protein